MRVRLWQASFIGITLAFTVVAGGAIRGQDGASGNPEAAKVTNPVPATPESIASGQKLFENNCTQCHGWDGVGGLPMGTVKTANLIDDKWDHGGTDGEIFYTIRHGVPPDLIMRPWEAFSDTDVWNLVNYIRSLHEPKK